MAPEQEARAEGHGSTPHPRNGKEAQRLAAQNGRATADELVQDVVEGYFDELANVRHMLNSRFDDLKSGSVKPIPGDDR